MSYETCISTQFSVVNMVTSALFSCPGCERKNFRSLTGVKYHFIKNSHPLYCPICERVFKDELGIIQHYQKYNKSKWASATPPNNIQQLSPPTSLSRYVEKGAPEEDLEPSEPGMGIPDHHGSSSFLASVPPVTFEESPNLGICPEI